MEQVLNMLSYVTFYLFSNTWPSRPLTLRHSFMTIGHFILNQNHEIYSQNSQVGYLKSDSSTQVLVTQYVLKVGVDAFNFQFIVSLYDHRLSDLQYQNRYGQCIRSC